MEKKTTVLVVDDHMAIRKGLCAMLAEDADIEVMGEACTGEDAILKVNELDPQVVLMDTRMPGIGGIEATREIKRAHPTTCVIMVTMLESEMYVVEALRAGAAGYLTIDVSQELLCHSVKAVADGGTIVVRSGLLRQAIEGLLQSPKDGRNPADSSMAGRLTTREMDVFKLLAQGSGNRAISAQLNLAEVTVKKHVQSLFGKLGVSDRINAAIAGVRMGLAP
ncbi:MAG: response regulator transcription factor [Dehalococcoidia bacterium]|nr:response regulator transcription factor [Dehalococcoidia bacterium]